MSHESIVVSTAQVAISHESPILAEGIPNLDSKDLPDIDATRARVGVKNRCGRAVLDILYP